MGRPSPSTALLDPRQQTTDSSASSSTSVATATATTVPTPHPANTPTTISGGNLSPTFGTPLLGGPITDFIGKYGTPNDHTDANSFHWFRDGSSITDGLIVYEYFSSNGYTHQVDSITVQAVNGNMPDMSSAVALCTVYNRNDAHQIKRFPIVDPSGKDTGLDVVYVSASLAREFAPADFTDGNGNNVQPGSFDIQYLGFAASKNGKSE